MARRILPALVFVMVGVGAVLLYQRVVPADPVAQGSGGGPGAGFGGGRAGGMGPQPMLVDTAAAIRTGIVEELSIVGNLVGAASVEVAPKVSGRLRRIDVRLGDRVTRGQVVARVEDDELRQQVSQADAAFEVARATIRQREADLLLAETSRDRSKNLFERALVSRQELDDAEARYQASAAQLDLVRAQFDQASARREELRINLANTEVMSPADGFIGRRYLDPGAWVTPNTALVSVVDVGLVRMVANLVERDLRLVSEGADARIEVDAYPGESFRGRVARIAPILDPATRSAEIEIEVPNPGARLKPGMYARVSLDVGRKGEALVVPRDAIVLRNSARGVFLMRTNESGSSVARFVPLVIGLQDDRHVEALDGLTEGDIVVTTGSAGLQHGDPVMANGPARGDDGFEGGARLPGASRDR